jgi:hypothetical protein
VYEHLRTKGVEFPGADQATQVPMNMPRRPDGSRQGQSARQGSRGGGGGGGGGAQGLGADIDEADAAAIRQAVAEAEAEVVAEEAMRRGGALHVESS